MIPGDMIEWVYRYRDNPQRVCENEMLYSSTMRQWVPIDVPAFLIAHTKDRYYWVSEKGLFYAHESDGACIVDCTKGSPRRWAELRKLIP